MREALRRFLIERGIAAPGHERWLDLYDRKQDDVLTSDLEELARELGVGPVPVG